MCAESRAAFAIAYDATLWATIRKAEVLEVESAQHLPVHGKGNMWREETICITSKVAKKVAEAVMGAGQ